MRVYIVRVCQREEIKWKIKTSRVCATNSAQERKLIAENMNAKCVRASRQSVTANKYESFSNYWQKKYEFLASKQAK